MCVRRTKTSDTHANTHTNTHPHTHQSSGHKIFTAHTGARTHKHVHSHARARAHTHTHTASEGIAALVDLVKGGAAGRT